MHPMACPYFAPQAPVTSADVPRPARAPLGAVYEGACRNGVIPDPALLIECCNFGYARGRCSAFPEDAACDAVRYSAPRDGADPVRVVWVREKDYAPLEHGVLNFAAADGACLEPAADPVVTLQAQAFVKHYLGR